MGLLDFLRKPQPIATFADVEEFLDTRAAFLVQKCTYEYARARAGVLWQKLFKEVEFQDAISRSAWVNYPLGLENVALMVEHTLRPYAGGQAHDLCAGLVAATDAATRRHPVPEGFSPTFWVAARKRIANRIGRAGLAPPLPVMDIPKATAAEFIMNLPIHRDVRPEDDRLLTNNLRVNLCAMHEELLRRSDSSALAGAIASRAAAAMSGR